jgi:peptide-methionine (R)-S-oxide reductase
MKPKLEKTDEAWREELGAEAYAVCRAKGTERAFSGAYWDCHDAGTYRCTCCGEALFDSEAKFDSGCGWPSFTAPIEPDAVEEHEDRSHFGSSPEAGPHDFAELRPRGVRSAA